MQKLMFGIIENERLPYALGWTRAADIISPSDFDGMSKRIVKATEELEQNGGN